MQIWEFLIFRSEHFGAALLVESCRRAGRGVRRRLRITSHWLASNHRLSFSLPERLHRQTV
ncbi:hypothetical protein CS345_17190 [Bordetella bronchiseptica]|nr:hypothetical protein CS345_17190 [Bordetella bronchiseptica]